MNNSQKQLAEIRKTTDLTMTEFKQVEKAVETAKKEGKKSKR